MRRRRGFTLAEIIVTLIVLAVVAAVSVISYQSVTDSVSGRADGPLLLSAQLEGRRTLTDDGIFPPSLRPSMLPLPGVTFVDGVAGASQVSVLRASDSVAVYATAGGAGCLMLVDRVGGAPTWGFDADGAQSCSAANAWSVLAVLVGGSDQAPLEVMLP